MAYADVNGTRLYYEQHGPPDAPVLVLNNGILMNAAASWRPQLGAFSSCYRVLVYDCRGQGQSEHPEAPYSMAQHADDLAALLDVLAVDRAHVLGISYGGEVAQAFAFAFPGRVRSLVLADTVSEVGPELRFIAEGWRAAALTGDPDLLFLVTVPWNFSPAFMAQQPAILAAARAGYGALDLQAVARLCEAFAGVNWTDRLPEISAPTCIMVGDADLIKGSRYADMLHRGIRGSRLHTIAGAGHATCWEAPARFNDVVMGFLRDLQGPGPLPVTPGRDETTGAPDS